MNNTERNMAAAILRFEDSRVTGPASLRVSRLPAADKGGKWEICGICDGIEPARIQPPQVPAGRRKAGRSLGGLPSVRPGQYRRGPRLDWF